MKLPAHHYKAQLGEDEFDVILRTRKMYYGFGIFMVWVAIVRSFRWLRHPRALEPWTTWRYDLWQVALIVLGFAALAVLYTIFPEHRFHQF